jgi:hypothetical protein
MRALLATGEPRHVGGEPIPRRGVDPDAGLTLQHGDDGYHRVLGLRLRLVIAELHRVAELEGDDVLRWFSRARLAR